MDLPDAAQVVLPLVVFALAVAFLLRCWPRPPRTFLTRERQSAELIDVVPLSHDTKRLRLSLGSKDTVLGLPVGKHLVVYAPNPASCLTSGRWNGQDDPDRGRPEVERKYTPVTGDECPGYVDLIIKVYRPGAVRQPQPNSSKTKWEDGGKVSLFLDSKQPGDYIDLRGPMGVHEYLGRGLFKTPGQTVAAEKVGMIAGGTGLTPMLQILQASLRDSGDRCKFRLLYANKTEDDILCREMLEELQECSQGRLKVFHTLDFPPAGWQGYTGFVTKGMVKECLPPPSNSTLVLQCGPPAMIECACKPSLMAVGFSSKSVVTF